MDETAVFQLTYGLFVIGCGREDKKGGCITNTAMQVNAEPIRVSVTIAKENQTHKIVQETGRISVSVLGEGIHNKVFGTFGFRHSSEIDKWAAFDYGIDAKGTPYLKESGVLAWFSGAVRHSFDVDTHTIFVIDVDEGENLEKGVPMTYAYYRKERRGQAPKAAPTYRPKKDGGEETSQEREPKGANFGYKCDICGHIEKSERLPGDYSCPVCTADRTHMHALYKRELDDQDGTREMRCPVCGYTTDDAQLVSGYRCPMCGVVGENFKPKEPA